MSTCDFSCDKKMYNPERSADNPDLSGFSGEKKSEYD